MPWFYFLMRWLSSHPERYAIHYSLLLFWVYDLGVKILWGITVCVFQFYCLCASLSNAFWSGQKWKWDCTFGLIVFDLDKPHRWDYILIAWWCLYCYLLLDCVYLARKQIWDWIFVWVCWIWVNIRTEKSHTSYTISFWIVRCP